MRTKAFAHFLTGALLLVPPVGAQSQSLGDILKGGVKSGKPAPQPPIPQQSGQPKPAKQAPAPEPDVQPAVGAGFRMVLPPGWRAELTQNQAVVARSNDGSSAVVIAPVMAPPEISAEVFLRRYAAQGLGGWFPNIAVTNVLPSRLGRAGALASLEFQSTAGPGRAAALLFMHGGLGTLYVIGSPASSFPQQQAALVRILRSFSFEGQPATGGVRSAQPNVPGPNLSFTRFTDPYEGAFSCEVPSGWKTQGGLVRKGTVDIRGFLRVTSPDGAIHVFFGDPEIGTFVPPNPTLAMTGFREGSAYSPGYGNVMIVRRYIPGLQFAQEYAARVAQSLGATALQARDARERPDLSGRQQGMAQEMWTAGEVSFGCNFRGVEGAGYVLAATKLTTIYETALWQVTTLVGYLAPVGRVQTASAAIQRVMQTLQINPNWYARQQQTTAQTSAIVAETHEHVSRIISDSYWSRQRVQDRLNENFTDYIRGRVRLRDPETGEELEGRAGNNYYWRVRGTNTIIGNDAGTPPPSVDVTELQQIR